MPAVASTSGDSPLSTACANSSYSIASSVRSACSNGMSYEAMGCVPPKNSAVMSSSLKSGGASGSRSSPLSTPSCPLSVISAPCVPERGRGIVIVPFEPWIVPMRSE